MGLLKCKYSVTGNAQGIGYRRYLKEQADILRVVGYAKNRRNGSVEILAEGNENSIDSFEEYLPNSPRNGRTLAVEQKLKEQIDKLSRTNFSILDEK